MKRSVIYILVVLLAIPFTLSAKKKCENPKADIKVSYMYHEVFLRGGSEVSERENEFVLLSNASHSKFYPPVSEYLDSLTSTPSGRQQYHQMLKAVMGEVVRTGNYDLVPHKKGDIYVFKNRLESTISVYELIGGLESGCYTDQLGDMEWNIADSTKTVLGYQCVMATTKYHGRQWTVWFTPEIPVQDGPWKLCGLPGLILEASEASGQHSFMATGIETSSKEIVPIYSPERYEKIERKELLRHKRKALENQSSFTSSIINNYPGSKNHAKAGAPVEKVVTDIDFLETDYRE